MYHSYSSLAHRVVFYHSDLHHDPIAGDLVLTLEVLPRLDYYASSLRNNLASREWRGSTPHDGVSLRLIHVAHLARGQVIHQSFKAKKLRLDIFEFHRQKVPGRLCGTFVILTEALD